MGHSGPFELLAQAGQVPLEPIHLIVALLELIAEGVDLGQRVGQVGLKGRHPVGRRTGVGRTRGGEERERRGRGQSHRQRGGARHDPVDPGLRRGPEEVGREAPVPQAVGTRVERRLGVDAHAPVPDGEAPEPPAERPGGRAVQGEDVGEPEGALRDPVSALEPGVAAAIRLGAHDHRQEPAGQPQHLVDEDGDGAGGHGLRRAQERQRAQARLSRYCEEIVDDAGALDPDGPGWIGGLHPVLRHDIDAPVVARDPDDERPPGGRSGVRHPVPDNALDAVEGPDVVGHRAQAHRSLPIGHGDEALPVRKIGAGPAGGPGGQARPRIG